MRVPFPSLRRPTKVGDASPRQVSLNLPRQVFVRLLLMSGLLAAFGVAWRHFSSIPLLVIGQPRVVGLLQSDQEAPFFRGLAARTGLPLKISYQSTDSFGLKDTHQLEALREGRIDIVSLRFMQNIAKEPALEGIDLPGSITDYRTAGQVIRAYSPSVDRYLQRDFRAKLLGIWTFGPQVMVCRSPITGLADLRGRKVRVASPGLGQLATAIGAVPAILSFEDTKQALAIGLVDCAVTSAASASFAGWTKHTRYYYPLTFQFGFNGYAISLKKWNELTPAQQVRLEQAFAEFNDSLWVYSQNLQRQSEACILGGRCRNLSASKLILVRPTSADSHLLQQLSRQIVLPAWSRRCEQKHPGCRRDWDQRVAPFTMLTQPTLRQP